MTDDRTIVAAEFGDTSSATNARSCPILLQYDGGTPGKRFLLLSSKITIGRRADKVQVWIDDASVSREHCSIEVHGNQSTVIDLGSLNHTYINDQIVTSHAELVHGDMLRVGNVRLRYFAHGSADQLLFDRIYRMAVQDRMLEIFRKEYVVEKLEEEFKIARNQGTPLSIIMLDLDKFKSVNDTYGHDAGDTVLKEVCTCIKTHLRQFDIFGRYGGEEFVIVTPKTTLEEAGKLAENIRAGIEKHVIDYDGVLIPVTISLGVACLRPEAPNSLDMVKAADIMVYASKNGGRNRVSL